MTSSSSWSSFRLSEICRMCHGSSSSSKSSHHLHHGHHSVRVKFVKCAWINIVIKVIISKPSWSSFRLSEICKVFQRSSSSSKSSHQIRHRQHLSRNVPWIIIVIKVMTSSSSWSSFRSCLICKVFHGSSSSSKSSCSSFRSSKICIEFHGSSWSSKSSHHIHHGFHSV
ncbi:unnamed protein product [Rotaria magnacalcarata]